MPALAGCGGVGTSPAAQSVGKQLTVYSSLPLQGPAAGISQQIVGGEKLALADAGGRVGRFTVSYVSLDDSSPTNGEWDPGVTAANAKAAAQDRTTIAYLGDFNSGATAVSLPLTNAAGILQVSPASPYVGLTSSLDAGQGEPERFYLGGRRTFGRVAPGDPVQAAAQVALLRRLNVRRLYVIADQDPFDGPLAQIVAADAQRAGIEVRGQDTIAILPGSTSPVRSPRSPKAVPKRCSSVLRPQAKRPIRAPVARPTFIAASSTMLNPLFASSAPPKV
jgi:branched-chain amino acid transport system substrate-binding protein